MTTIKEYARTHSVSYEAIRSQVSRYREDLSGHVIVKGKTKYLDDFAVDFLDSKRKSNPVVIDNQGSREEVTRLREQLEALKNELMWTQKQVIDLQSENKLMIEAKVKYSALLDSNNDKQKLIETLQTDLEKARDAEKVAQAEADQSKSELQSFRKSIFGLYRKIRKP